MKLYKITIPDVDVVEEESQSYSRLEATVCLVKQCGKHDLCCGYCWSSSIHLFFQKRKKPTPWNFLELQISTHALKCCELLRVIFCLLCK